MRAELVRKTKSGAQEKVNRMAQIHAFHPDGDNPGPLARVDAAVPPGPDNPPIFTAIGSRHARSARLQRLAAHLHAAEPRPCLEALIEVAHGRDLDDVLERFARIRVNTYRALGADELPINRLAVINGNAA
jgi:hypothetical protein